MTHPLTLTPLPPLAFSLSLWPTLILHSAPPPAGGALANFSNGLPPPPPQAGPRVLPSGTGGPPQFRTSSSFGTNNHRAAPAGSMVATRTGTEQDAYQLYDGAGAAALKAAAATAAAVGSASGFSLIDLTALDDNSDDDGRRTARRTTGGWTNPGSARSNSSIGEEDYTTVLIHQYKEKFVEVMERRRAHVKELSKAATRWRYRSADRDAIGQAEYDKNKSAIITEDAAKYAEVKTLWGSKYTTLDTVVSMKLAKMDSALMKLLDMPHYSVDTMFSALWGWAETVDEMQGVWIPDDIDPPPQQDLDTSADYAADGFESNSED